MSDPLLLHAVLSGAYDPIKATSTRPCVFLKGDAIRAMEPQGWTRQRVTNAMGILLDQGNARCSALSDGFGGNTYVYALTTKPLAA
jgi:hypothetical protein